MRKLAEGSRQEEFEEGSEVEKQIFKHHCTRFRLLGSPVLERPSASGEFSPVLIDFGKSLKVSSVTLYRRNGTVMKCKGKSYLAPEVVSERLYGVASDIFSLGRMLKAISSLLGFYERVRELVKMSTRDKPSERPSLYVFSRKIADVKF